MTAPALPPLFPETTLSQVLQTYPGAQRALFARYHIGGCSSCAFSPTETLAQLCVRNENLDVQEVISHIQDSHQGDATLQISPADFAALRSANTDLGATVVIVTHDAAVSSQVQRTVAIRDGRTASEVVRRNQVDEHGTSTVVAEEYAVLDRVGRLQLPADYRSTLGLRDRVRLELENDHIGIWPDRAQNDAAQQKKEKN